MRRTLIAVCAFFVVPCCSMNASGQNAVGDVHLVGIYEGYEQTGNTFHGPKTLIDVDRPGKQVTLVLTSYSGATWYISASKGTRIKRVILGGYKEQAVEGLPEATIVTKAWRGQSRTPLGYSYKPTGPKFRQLIKQTYALTKTDLASFHGTYSPKSGVAISINAVQNDEKLSVDYPKPTPLDKLPADVRALTFNAHRYIAGRRGFQLATSFGQYTLSGPVINSLKPLADRVTRVTYDPDGKTFYGISGHGVVQINQKKETTPLKLGLGVPRLSWPCEITYDTKRKRVILGSSGGGGFLYAFSTKTRKWSVISKRPGSLDAFVYSPKDDFICGVLFEHASGGNIASLARVNAEGAIVSRIPLGPPLEPGSLTNGPGVCTTQVAIVGKYIAILVSLGGIGDRNKIDAAAIYLVDPVKKRVWLTYKKTASK